MTVPYPIFRAALEAGDLARALTLAREMPQMRLDDALRVCLLLRDGDPDRFERAAVRWLGRFALEGTGVMLDDLQEAADALDALPQEPDLAMEQLQALCLARGIG